MELSAWYANVAIHHAHWIKLQTHVNKRNATAIARMSEETLKSCLLPMKARYFICDHSRTKTVKKEVNDASVLEDVTSVESFESNGLSNKASVKKRRVAKKLQLKLTVLRKLLKPFCLTVISVLNTISSTRPIIF